MFAPTHVLVSRGRKTPVQLMAAPHGFKLVTEQEWESDRTPAFEIRPKRGIYCQGVPVVGYRLEPISTKPLSAPHGLSITT